LETLKEWGETIIKNKKLFKSSQR